VEVGEHARKKQVLAKKPDHESGQRRPDEPSKVRAFETADHLREIDSAQFEPDDRARDRIDRERFDGHPAPG
jgi:hypothetical protein